MSEQREQNLMDAAPLDELFLHHFGCGKIEKIRMLKLS
jgi:hypothetical protein